MIDRWHKIVGLGALKRDQRPRNGYLVQGTEQDGRPFELPGQLTGIGDARLERPLVLGHENAGVIADGPRRGQRVAIDPAIPDETCPQCRRGYRNLCPQVRFAGHGVTDGGLREFAAWPTSLLHPLPGELSDDDGAGGVGELLELAQMLVGRAPGAGALQWRADEHRAIDRRNDVD